MFKGALTAIVTPFVNGQVDEEGLRDLIEFQIEQGINGLVPCGTTGESPTLSHAEHKRVVEITVHAVNKRVPVVSGAGSNCTAEALDFVKHAMEVGADATLQVTPYYNKPTQEGCYQHFKAIADLGLPVVIYNIQSRCGINIETPTMARLAEHKNIVAVKEASGSIQQMADVYRACGDKIDMLSGDDGVTLPLLSIGGKGIISVLSNVIPAELVKLCRLWDEGDTKGALDHFMWMLPMMKAIFFESNPIPIKAVMAEKGLIKSSEARLPITTISDEAKERVFQVFRDAGVL